MLRLRTGVLKEQFAFVVGKKYLDLRENFWGCGSVTQKT